MIQILADYGLWALGIIAACAGWGFRYILGNINGKIRGIQATCQSRAKAVEDQVAANRAKHDADLAALRLETREQMQVLDRDIKTVGESVRSAVASLRQDLFLELKSSRQELNTSVQQVNQRLDTLISSNRGGGV